MRRPPISKRTRFWGWTSALALASLGAAGAAEAVRPDDLTSFATRYAAAWSGQDPEALASFYEKDGRLVVNGGEPAIARAAVAATARAYMEAYPDMVVAMDAIEPTEDGAVFRWTWTGTNTGPGGTGASVNLRGHEAWTFGPSGLIALSDGHYDAAEYERQVNASGSPLAWMTGHWEGVRIAAADGERAPLRLRAEPLLGGSAVVLDLEVRGGDGSTYRGVSLLYPGPDEAEWTMVYTSGGRAPAVYRGEVSSTGAELRSGQRSDGSASRLRVERLDDGAWRRTMTVSRDGGATWAELWRDEMHPADLAP